MPTLNESFRNSKHKCYMRHLYNNFKLKHKDLALKDKLYDCTRAETIPEFEEQMKQI